MDHMGIRGMGGMCMFDAKTVFGEFWFGGGGIAASEDTYDEWGGRIIVCGWRRLYIKKHIF